MLKRNLGDDLPAHVRGQDTDQAAASHRHHAHRSDASRSHQGHVEPSREMLGVHVADHLELNAGRVAASELDLWG